MAKKLTLGYSGISVFGWECWGFRVEIQHGRIH